VAFAWVLVFVYPLGTPGLYATIFWRHRRELRPLIDASQSHQASKALVGLTRTSTFTRTVEERLSRETRVLVQAAIAEEEAEDTQCSSSTDTHTRTSESNLRTSTLRTGLSSVASRSANMTLKLEQDLPRYLRPLVAPYDYECYWFEMFECLRKVALTGITTFLPRGSLGQLVLGLVLCVVLSWCYHNWKPYKIPENDALAQLCQAVVFFVMVSKIIVQNYGAMAEAPGWLIVVDGVLTTSIVLPFAYAAKTTISAALKTEAGIRYRKAYPRRTWRQQLRLAVGVLNAIAVGCRCKKPSTTASPGKDALARAKEYNSTSQPLGTAASATGSAQPHAQSEASAPCAVPMADLDPRGPHMAVTVGTTAAGGKQEPDARQETRQLSKIDRLKEHNRRVQQLRPIGAYLTGKHAPISTAPLPSTPPTQAPQEPLLSPSQLKAAGSHINSRVDSTLQPSVPAWCPNEIETNGACSSKTSVLSARMQSLWDTPRLWAENVFAPHQPQLKTVVEDAVVANAAALNSTPVTEVHGRPPPSGTLHAEALRASEFTARGSLMENSEARVFLTTVVKGRGSDLNA